MAFALYAVLALSRWNAGLVTSFDLGIFSQSADSYASGRLPVSHIRELSLLGDHFSPIMSVFGVVWLVWSDPRALLLAQAALLALAVAGVAALALRWLRPVQAVAVVVALLLSRGLLAAVLFDVHEVAFAAPLLVVLCWAVATERFRIGLLAAAVLLLVKEDLGLTVGAAGVAWWLFHSRPSVRRAATFVLLGIVGMVVAMATVAHFSPTGASGYLGYFSLGSTHAPAVLADDSGQWFERLAPLVLFASSAMIVGLRSPLAVIAAPTLAWRVLSSNPSYWHIDFHYDVVPTVVAACAAVEGLRRCRWTPRVQWLLIASAALSVVLGATQVAHRASADVVPGPRVHQVDAVAAHLAGGTRVAALNNVGPYLVARHDVYNLSTTSRAPVDYAAFVDRPEWDFLYSMCDRRALLALAGSRGWDVQRSGDVVLVRFPRRMPVPVLCGDRPTGAG
ncbi:DUF2079 domain-containing protein [Luteipulveratus flavus]|uniref:DUF2079 domain-containing protein n=1 Tax=Luteipulveratus flavus TaxID=3031728 RepID=A0ABT6C491_9MICO|nr:DUF2079 domain-containing protein [Luteipulveratus sp. YIM 133296]MDF8263690.1 DUF2079 domain-containing protein [Luteipulveratus sp. YIM 133296]